MVYYYYELSVGQMCFLVDNGTRFRVESLDRVSANRDNKGSDLKFLELRTMFVAPLPLFFWEDI